MFDLKLKKRWHEGAKTRHEPIPSSPRTPFPYTVWEAPSPSWWVNKYPPSALVYIGPNSKQIALTALSEAQHPWVQRSTGRKTGEIRGETQEKEAETEGEKTYKHWGRVLKLSASCCVCYQKAIKYLFFFFLWCLWEQIKWNRLNWRGCIYLSMYFGLGMVCTGHMTVYSKPSLFAGTASPEVNAGFNEMSLVLHLPPAGVCFWAPEQEGRNTHTKKYCFVIFWKVAINTTTELWIEAQKPVLTIDEVGDRISTTCLGKTQCIWG